MKNSQYWQLRFTQLEQAQNKMAAESSKEIEQQYKQAQKEIEAKINTWYQRFAKNNGITMAEARQFLKNADLTEFKWDVQDYIKYGQDNALMGGWTKELENASAKFHISRLEALKIQTQQSIEAMFTKQLGIVSATMQNVYESGYFHTAYELQKGFGVGWDIAGLNQSAIEKVISKPWTVDGKNFSERIWGNKQRLISEIHSDLTQNIMLGADPQKAINSIAKKMNISKTNAGKLVMTEEAYFSSAAQKDCFEELDVEEYEIVDNAEDLSVRPPIVTIMGHVDHGKTTLLDYIRNSHVVEGEFGGITQHIGAYQIETNGSKITFIDTPGHAAFTEMRARGASVTDIVIIIVASDDGVMPQTKEAVEHALSANVPIVVAVNKIDKPAANPERIMTEMAELNITPEAWGGTIPFINISAHTGEGIDKLLETILAISEMAELKANPSRYAVGSVIESRQDKNVGGVASLLILNGTLRLGDPIVVGTTFGKVRTMKNDLGESITMAHPGTPVEITGLNENPSAGDKFMAFETEKEAKEIAEKRAINAKENKYKKDIISLDDLFSKINEGQKEINVVLKADVRGSEEAVKNSLLKIKY